MNRGLRRFVPLVVLATGLAMVAPASARAGVPPPREVTQYCARLVVLRDVASGVNAAASGAEVFAAIAKTAKEFRKVAADAPEPIAEAMALLAGSVSDLDRALQPLAATVRPAKSEAALDRMLTRIRRVIARWADAQDQAAVGAAQAAVDDWTESYCGFRLSGDSGSTGSGAGTTTTTVPATSTTTVPGTTGR